MREETIKKAITLALLFLYAIALGYFLYGANIIDV